MGDGWRLWALDEICAMHYGKQPRRADVVAQGYPIFSGYRVIGYHRRWLYEHPEVVVIARGAGGCGEVRFSPPGAFITNLAIVLQVVHPEVDQRFLYYRLAYTTLRELCSGAAQPQIVLSDLRRYRVALPPLAIQRTIADALSAYDALIANNQRRMVLLEQVLHRLYHEWFTLCRFPGAGAMRRSEGAQGSAGWEQRPFSALAHFVNGFAFGPRHWGANGLPIVKIAELKRGFDKQTMRCDARMIPARYHVHTGDVLFSWSADLQVYLWGKGDALLNQHIFNVQPFAEFTRLFLFCALTAHLPAFRSRSRGTTMSHITRAALDQVMVAVPPAELRAAFEAHAMPFAQLLLNLAAQNMRLRHACTVLQAQWFGRAAMQIEPAHLGGDMR